MLLMHIPQVISVWLMLALEALCLYYCLQRSAWTVSRRCIQQNEKLSRRVQEEVNNQKEYFSAQNWKSLEHNFLVWLHRRRYFEFLFMQNSVATLSHLSKVWIIFMKSLQFFMAIINKNLFAVCYFKYSLEGKLFSVVVTHRQSQEV